MEAAAEETQKDGTESVPADTNSNEKPSTPAEQPKKSRKDERMKKDEKNVEQFMKSLNSVPTLEEKLSLVCKKYVQTADDNKKMQFYIKQSDKRYALLLKEKEQLQLEFNKTILVKSKLENLCRELQKQNKAIKEESLLKIREEEERRKETQAKFQNTLSEITALLQQNNEKNAKLRDDNISMSEKFKSVVQQYQLREQQVDKMAKQMALESQLSDAKLQKASLEHQADRERLLAEMEQIKVNVAQYRAKIVELQGTETNLRSQLAVYTDKYDEFQKALVKSNQVFGGFKEQMEMMTKKIKKLEKESLSWKKRWETSQSALIEMCTERQAGDERAAAAARHLHHMQGLCRTLQAERAVLLATLKEHNIERPPLPPPPPAPAPPPPAPAPASNAKVDAMAANCAQLRQSLAHLQSQLNVLTNKQQNSTPEEPPKPDKPKKSKSKKKSQKAQEKVEVEEVAKEIEEIQPSVNEVKVESTPESPDEKVDDKTLESLIEAINSANINLCDLEVGNGDSEDVLEEILKGVENTTEDVLDVETNENSKIELPNVKNNGELSSEDISKIESIVTEIKEIKEQEKVNVVEEITNDVAADVTEVENESIKVEELKIEDLKVKDLNIEELKVEDVKENKSVESPVEVKPIES